MIVRAKWNEKVRPPTIAWSQRNRATIRFIFETGYRLKKYYQPRGTFAPSGLSHAIERGSLTGAEGHGQYARMTGLRWTRASIALVFVVAAAAMGCAPVLENRSPAGQIPPAQVAAMPPVVLIYTLDWRDRKSVEEAATREIEHQVELRMRETMAANGGKFLSAQALDACGPPCASFFHWGGIATLEIGVRRQVIQTYRRHSVAEWRYDGPLSPVHAYLDADFALFLVLKQTRETDGRKGLGVAAGYYTVGKQIDAACIADLRDGRMTWCTSQGSDTNDIADRERLAPVLRALLQDVFRVPTQIYEGPPIPLPAGPPSRTAPSPSDGP